MLRRKNYWLLFAIILLSLTSLSPSMELNTGDGPHEVKKPQNQNTDSSAGEKGTVDSLRISVSLNPEEFQELERISATYSLSSGVKVELVNVSSEDAERTLKQDLTLGNSPDIVMTDGRNILDLATRGFLLPVDVYQSIPGSAPLTGLIPLMQWNGYDWGVPLDIDPYVMVYSPQRLKELGFNGVPRNLEEWNTLLQNVHKEQGISLLALDTRNPYGLAAVLESMGGSLLKANPEWLDWIQLGRSSFYLTSRYNQEVWDRLQGGRIAVAVLPLSEWQKHGNSSLAAEALLQAGQGAGLESIYSRSFALPAQSRNPEAAVEWLAYITSLSSQQAWLDNTGRLPALDELYRMNQPAFTQLPFDTGLLLSEEAAPVSESQGSWSRVTEAVLLLLTGKLDTAAYMNQVRQASE
ncbi:extracellular solute-binding protein [Paenibacillus albidus]|uniref:extracellular solute-binding protein n=1 Tax=Paenibacillus albidus TaxID=2041023 RepID=UPI001BE65E16|nr:extracellular solute-binding protein [Paenibacillus albidus]MBT2288083.1 extracellular solute-binding protein [Paenibacillus albidus]